MAILNFGSLNVDYVYRLPRVVRGGETLAARTRDVFAGGKGLNQSVALARAGAKVFHAGAIGDDGHWLLQKLQDAGVDTRHVHTVQGPTGHAMIQVDDQGENAIVLHGGANHQLTLAHVDQTLSSFGSDDILLLQNEVNLLPELLHKGRQRHMKVAFNPAPFAREVLDYPLHEADVLFVNETEACGLTGTASTADQDDVMQQLRKRLPDCVVVMTLGSRGAWALVQTNLIKVAAPRVQAIDTTAAGDTFIGYFLAALAQGVQISQAMHRACAAAALCVTRRGAMDAIPQAEHVDAFMQRQQTSTG